MLISSPGEIPISRLLVTAVYPSFPMTKLGLFAGTVITKETIEPNDGDLLGASLFGCIGFFFCM